MYNFWTSRTCLNSPFYLFYYVVLSSLPTHSSLDFDQCSENLLIFLATSNNLQTHGSICKSLWRVKAVDPCVLRILWRIIDVRDVKIGVYSGHWEDNPRVV